MVFSECWTSRLHRQQQCDYAGYPKTSFVMGDSGGYQVGTGALPDIKGWAKHAKDPTTISTLWRSSRVKEDILRRLDSHCDYAMTLDMPLLDVSKVFNRQVSQFRHTAMMKRRGLELSQLHPKRHVQSHRIIAMTIKPP